MIWAKYKISKKNLRSYIMNNKIIIRSRILHYFFSPAFLQIVLSQMYKKYYNLKNNGP